MLSRHFPKQIDNGYRGHRLSLWLLFPVQSGRIAVGVNGTFNTRFVAMAANDIPLDSYGAGAAQNVVALFALALLVNLVVGFLGVIVMIRWRAMIPFLYLLMLLQSIAGRIILYAHPLARSGAQTVQIGSLFLLCILALGDRLHPVAAEQRRFAQMRPHRLGLLAGVDLP